MGKSSNNFGRPPQRTKRGIAIWLKARSTVVASGCWDWIAGMHGVGYGSVPSWCGGGNYAHRAMFAAVVSDIPHRMYVMHSCDNRKCVNPEHLFLGTHLDNIKDMHAKNRQRGGSLPNEKNPSCKFTDEQIRIIKDDKFLIGLNATIRKYGISETHLLRVMRGESRKGI